jgi:uncharacterized membrane protein YvlD (DUF360 family)
VTSTETGGRMLQTGRTVARILLVWAVATGALIALDSWMTGFELPAWWHPPVAALLLGLLTAGIWPLVLRVALPVAFFTFGIGGFVLLGGLVLALFHAIPGVEIRGLGVAVVVVLVMAAVAGVTSSVLAIDEDEVFFRRARRRTGRGGQPAAERDARPPGVLFLQIDGLGHDVARRAVRDGSMPTLAAWLRAGSHVLTGWHTDWSSQTGSAVLGILHGSNHDVIGFRWYDKERDHVVRVSTPEDAAAQERLHSDGRGLLAPDGAGRGNLFTGDAPHVSLTMSSLAHVVPTRSRVRRRERERVGSGYYAYFANPANAMRTLGVSLVDIYRELVAAAKQRRADVRPRISRGGIYPLARPGTTVIARDIVTSALLEDMLAGRAVVYADFLGYDEVAHHSGVERFDTLEVLRSIDQQIGRLHRAAALAPREYHLVCLSDHGQTQGWAFAERFGESIEQLVGRVCGGGTGPKPSAGSGSRRTAEGWQVAAAAAEAGGGLVARRLRARVAGKPAVPGEPAATGGEVPRVAPGVVCVVSGHVAMVSFPDLPGRVPLEEIERRWPDLLPTLVDHDGVGFVLVHSTEHGPVVLGRDGLHRLATGVVLGEDPLAPYGEHAADLVARTSAFPHCADVMINSRYDPDTDEASAFEPHVGSHGGLGGPQTRGFLVHPRVFAAPGAIVGAEHLHRVLRGWLADLGHPVPEVADEPGPASRAGLDRVPDDAAAVTSG